MRKKTIVIVLITIISLIELLFIKPIIPPYFGMTLTWKALYLITLFGFPVLIVIPIALFVAPIAILFKRGKNFKPVWLNYIQNTFLGFGIIILTMSTALIVSKYRMNNDPFPLIKYSEIQGFDGSTKNLLNGKFESQFGIITRNGDKQVETYVNGDSSEFKIEWISNNEYRLVYQGDNLGMNDQLYVKITNNTPEYYECYIKVGEYADYQKITKK
jgi:hypothetical protein